MKKFLNFASLALFLLPSVTHADPSMNRIKQSGTIRCGYMSYALAAYSFSSASRLQGYMVDVMEEASKRMKLKLEWVRTTNPENDLKDGKFDIITPAHWSHMPRNAEMPTLSSDPIFYKPVFFAVRAEDNRFDADISKANDPDVTIIVQAKAAANTLRELYANANILVMPLSADYATRSTYEEVTEGRADATITSKPDMESFKIRQPGKLKLITSQPVRLFPAVIRMPEKAIILQKNLNNIIRGMREDGTIERIMKKYASGPDDFYMVSSPYSKIEGLE